MDIKNKPIKKTRNSSKKSQKEDDSSCQSENQEEKVQKIQVYCSKGKLAKFCCKKQNCQKNAAVCARQNDCECRNEHIGHGTVAETQSIIDALQSKVISIKPLENCIVLRINKTIDILSKMREDFLRTVREKFYLCGLNDEEKQFLDQMKKGKSINGHQAWLVDTDCKKVQLIVNQINQKVTQLNQVFDRVDVYLQKPQYDVNSIIEDLQQFHSDCLIAKRNYNDTRYNSTFTYTPKYKSNFIGSKVVTTDVEISTIKSFFENKKIKAVKLLYRGSDTENNFSAAKFHQKCDNIPNTIVICYNEFKMKFGGYTPIAWGQSNSFKQDNNKESFIFQLNHKEKLKLIRPQYTVSHSSSYGPTFGSGHDLYISNNANQNNSSSSSIGHSYQHDNYTYGDKNSLYRFNGNPSSQYTFKLTEYQVWSIEFK